jgi:hypothetical protein
MHTIPTTVHKTWAQLKTDVVTNEQSSKKDNYITYIDSNFFWT